MLKELKKIAKEDPVWVVKYLIGVESNLGLYHIPDVMDFRKEKRYILSLLSKYEHIINQLEYRYFLYYFTSLFKRYDTIDDESLKEKYIYLVLDLKTTVDYYYKISSTKNIKDTFDYFNKRLEYSLQVQELFKDTHKLLITISKTKNIKLVELIGIFYSLQILENNIDEYGNDSFKEELSNISKEYGWTNEQVTSYYLLCKRYDYMLEAIKPSHINKVISSFLIFFYDTKTTPKDELQNRISVLIENQRYFIKQTIIKSINRDNILKILDNLQKKFLLFRS